MNFVMLPTITYICMYVYSQTKYLCSRKLPTCVWNVYDSREIYPEAFLLSKEGKGSPRTSENSRNSQNQGQIYPFLL